MVIIDEYLELFHHHQEWIQLVIHIGQEGRGCNVFFTLGGQRLDLSSLSKVKSNIAFRVALRAETAEDSRDVIGSDAALHLPSKENGYALLKVGPRDLEPFRCFYLSGPFVVPKKVAVNSTVDVSFSQPRPLTWEYQPLSDEDNAALAVADESEEPDEFLFHSDGFRRRRYWTSSANRWFRTLLDCLTKFGFPHWKSVTRWMPSWRIGGASRGMSTTGRTRVWSFQSGSLTSPTNMRNECMRSMPRWTTSSWSRPPSGASRPR